jgi:hypothetical protein
VLGRGGPEQGQRLLEEADRAARVPAAEGELAESGERGAAIVLERILEEPLGGLEIVEPERDLGVEECGLPGDRPVLAPGREVVRADAEALAELAQDLERRNPVAGLDPRDVGGGAALERELALVQARALPRFPEPRADLGGAIDMG